MFISFPNPEGRSLLAFASTETGNKKALKESAAYPRGFGLAVAGLVGERGAVLSKEISDFSYLGEGDDLGCLDDLLKGSSKAWWRHLKWSTKTKIG